MGRLSKKKNIILPVIPIECEHNAHMFYLKCKNLEERTKLILHLKEHSIMAVFHYIPLHSAQAGLKFGRFYGEDIYTTKESEKLLRLPMYFSLSKSEQEFIIEAVYKYYDKWR